MSLSKSTISAIQKIGAAAFTVNAKLKKEVSDCAARVNSAVIGNPYNLENDSLIETWKAVARISQTLTGIEEELKNVYQIASDLTADDQPTRKMYALPGPTQSASGIKRGNEGATDAVVKKKNKTKATKAKTASGQGKSLRPGSNSTKLLSYFQSTLTPNESVEVSQTAVAKETGIPMGSMSAAIKKLSETGFITIGSDGRVMLDAALTSSQAPSNS